MTAMASGEWQARRASAPVPITHLNDQAHVPAPHPAEPSPSIHLVPNITPNGNVTTQATPVALERASSTQGGWTSAGGRLVDDLQGRLYLTYAKRTIDVVLAAILLTVFSPIMLAIACLIVLDSPGRAIYSQRRVGRGRREFTIYKFRSMVFHAHVILENDPELSAQYAVHWKLIRDPRVTRFGGFLRKTSLDELPQLFNVLKGEMSIVGPRPYLPQELNDEFGAHADLITSVKPGITGLWQVSGRSQLAPHERIKLDETYVQTSTASLDLRILAKTVKAVIKSYGAY